MAGVVFESEQLPYRGRNRRASGRLTSLFMRITGIEREERAAGWLFVLSLVFLAAAAAVFFLYR